MAMYFSFGYDGCPEALFIKDQYVRVTDDWG
jgi:hypothetical protein